MVKDVQCYVYHPAYSTGKHLFKVSRNSEANASEFLENPEEMFPRYRK